MSHVFISYVKENQEKVRSLCDELAKQGVKVWLDRNHIKPGLRWKDAIKQAIRSGDFFIACFSKEYESRGKTYMNEELVLAIDELRQYPSDRTWFIPVLLSECNIPARSIGSGETLLDIQWVELFTNWNAGIQRILDVIQPIPEEVQRHIQALQSNDSIIRMRAAGELARIGNVQAIPALIDALRDEDMHVRSDVARAFSIIRDARAVPALIKALVDKENDRVREQASSALLNIGRPAIAELKDALSNENRAIRAASARILETMGRFGGIREALEVLEEYGRIKNIDDNKEINLY